MSTGWRYRVAWSDYFLKTTSMSPSSRSPEPRGLVQPTDRRCRVALWFDRSDILEKVQQADRQSSMARTSLLQLSLGNDFHQPINDVARPAAFRRLELGHSFNHSIDHVVWPSSLNRLVLDNRFDQPITRVAWPATDQSLAVGSLRNYQLIEDVVWSITPQKRSFGHGFDRPIENVVWPRTLLSTPFGDRF